MTKDRQNMQHRYIELFNDGAGGRKGRAGGGGGGFGNRGGTLEKNLSKQTTSDVLGLVRVKYLIFVSGLGWFW